MSPTTSRVAVPDGTGIIGDIEVLRAIAVLFVICAHLPYLLFWGPRRLNLIFEYVTLWGGVDLFFAVSGFVIARNLMPKLQQASIDGNVWTVAGGFWIRRAFRILPTAWLWLIFGLIASVSFNRSGVFSTFKGD